MVVTICFLCVFKVKAFFETLDDELKKVDQFYKSKESEFLERGEILNKQLQILLDLKQVLSDRRRKSVKSQSTFGFLSQSYSSSPRNSDFSGEINFPFCPLKVSH